MSEELAKLFEEVAQATGFEVSGDYLPLPPDMANHFFLNCVCPIGYTKGEPEAVLEKCRGATRDALIKVALRPPSEVFSSLCLSIFDIPVSGENIRIYRTRVDSEQLKTFSNCNFASKISGEESQLPEISKLLV